MYNNATFVDEKQLEFLKEMDTWLANEPWQSDIEIKTAMEVRTMITKIEDKGYYYEGEAELLNIMRSEYLKYKKKNKKKRL
tara:strand:- start:353 stop:595 length:243 start_codon:yes stop_codon:yes gene_type:complete